MKTITLEIEKVTVLLTDGADKICILTKLPTTFPVTGDPTWIDVSCKHDYGIEWCRKVLGIEPEVVSSRHGF